MSNKWPDGWDMDKFFALIFNLFLMFLMFFLCGGGIYVIQHFIVKYW